MKLYFHPVSTTSRPILFFAADNKDLQLDLQVVDLFTGEHMQPAYLSINPNGLVPTLVDEDFTLTESSSIIKYLADKFDISLYPKDLKKRAKVNELMDWFNTGFYRDFAYGLVYPQIYPNNKREDETVQAGVIAWGREKTREWLAILDKHMIGPKNAYVCGDALTLADYFGAAMLTTGEVIHLDYSAYPNIQRWIATMKARPGWQKANEGFYAYLVEPLKDASFQGL
jgi:glutathione S-transferase